MLASNTVKQTNKYRLPLVLVKMLAVEKKAIYCK